MPLCAWVLCVVAATAAAAAGSECPTTGIEPFEPLDASITYLPAPNNHFRVHVRTPYLRCNTTYVIDFAEWDQTERSIAQPNEPCENRAAANFSGVPFPLWWRAAPFANASIDAIGSGAYLAYPPVQGTVWTALEAEGAETIIYEAYLSLSDLLACRAGPASPFLSAVHINDTDPDFIVYEGTIYVHAIQPEDATLAEEPSAPAMGRYRRAFYHYPFRFCFVRSIDALTNFTVGGECYRIIITDLYVDATGHLVMVFRTEFWCGDCMRNPRLISAPVDAVIDPLGEDGNCDTPGPHGPRTPCAQYWRVHSTGQDVYFGGDYVVMWDFYNECDTCSDHDMPETNRVCDPLPGSLAGLGPLVRTYDVALGDFDCDGDLDIAPASVVPPADRRLWQYDVPGGEWVNLGHGLPSGDPFHIVLAADFFPDALNATDLVWLNGEASGRLNYQNEQCSLNSLDVYWNCDLGGVDRPLAGAAVGHFGELADETGHAGGPDIVDAGNGTASYVYMNLRPDCGFCTCREELPTLTNATDVAVAQLDGQELDDIVFARLGCPVQVFLHAGLHGEERICSCACDERRTPSCISTDQHFCPRFEEVEGAVQGGTNCAPDEWETSRVQDGLLALWAFKEGEGNTTADLSGVAPAMPLTLHDPYAEATWVLGDTNGVTFADDHRAYFSADGGGTSKLTETLQDAGEITIEAWVLPTQNSESGASPRRIVTFSDGTSCSEYNFHMGQKKKELTFRLRGVGSCTSSSTMSASNVFRRANEAVHVAVTYDGEVKRYYRHGVSVDTDNVEDRTDFSNWLSDVHFLVGNEWMDGNPSSRRPFEGTIFLVALYARALCASEISLNAAQGPCPDCSGALMYPRGIALGDVDNDGIPDLITAQTRCGGSMAHLGDGLGHFAYVEDAFPPVVRADDVALADMNCDGCLDAVFVDTASGAPRLYLGRCDGTFFEYEDAFGNPEPPDQRRRSGGGGGGHEDWPDAVLPWRWRVKVADIDGDGCLDVLIVSNETSLHNLFRGNCCMCEAGGCIRLGKGDNATLTVEMREAPPQKEVIQFPSELEVYSDEDDGGSHFDAMGTGPYREGDRICVRDTMMVGGADVDHFLVAIDAAWLCKPAAAGGAVRWDPDGGYYGCSDAGAPELSAAWTLWPEDPPPPDFGTVTYISGEDAAIDTGNRAGLCFTMPAISNHPETAYIHLRLRIVGTQTSALATAAEREEALRITNALYALGWAGCPEHSVFHQDLAACILTWADTSLIAVWVISSVAGIAVLAAASWWVSTYSSARAPHHGPYGRLSERGEEEMLRVHAPR